MPSLWPYATPGIPDSWFEQLPGIPISKREIRLLILGALRLAPDAVLWDIGAGTGTIVVEAALLCPKGRVVAVERDAEVVSLIQQNCDRFEVTNVEVIEGLAPTCFAALPLEPDCIIIEGGRPLKQVLQTAWEYLPNRGRLVVTASNLEVLYTVSETFSELQVRNVEIVQPAVNRLERRGHQQIFRSIDPTFILSGEKLA